MDKTYKVVQVSPNPAKPYTNSYGTTFYRDVRLADEQGVEHAKPVSLGKKSEDAFVVGMELYGHILVEQSHPTDKFKAATKQQGFGGGGGFSQPASNAYAGSSKPAYQPRDDDAIRAQWAIGQAVTVQSSLKAYDSIDYRAVEETAKTLYAMVNRVKGSNTELPTATHQTAPATHTGPSEEDVQRFFSNNNEPIPPYQGE